MARRDNGGGGMYGIPAVDFGAFDRREDERLPVAPRGALAGAAMAEPYGAMPEPPMAGPGGVMAAEPPAAPMTPRQYMGAPPDEVLIEPPGGGMIAMPARNVAPGATWAHAGGGDGVATEFRLRPAPGPAEPPAAPTWNAAPGAGGGEFTNFNGNVFSRLPAAPAAGAAAGTAPGALTPVTPVIAALEAQDRAGTATRRGVERSMGSGGPTSARNRAVAGAMAQERARAAGNADADLAAARQRAQPQAAAGAAGMAMWDGEKWVARGNQEAASGAGGMVTIDAEGRVTQTAAPAREDPDPVDPVTGWKRSELVKGYFNALRGKEKSIIYQIKMAGAKTDAEREQIEKQYAPDESEAEIFAAQLRRTGVDMTLLEAQDGGAPPAAEPAAATEPANRSVMGKAADWVERQVKGTPPPAAPAASKIKVYR